MGRGKTTELDFDELMIQLNSHLSDVGTDEPHFFSYETGEFWAIIKFNDYVLWSSEDDERIYLEELNDYEPLISFIKRKFNSYVEDLSRLKFAHIPLTKDDIYDMEEGYTKLRTIKRVERSGKWYEIWFNEGHLRRDETLPYHFSTKDYKLDREMIVAGYEEPCDYSDYVGVQVLLEEVGPNFEIRKVISKDE